MLYNLIADFQRKDGKHIAFGEHRRPFALCLELLALESRSDFWVDIINPPSSSWARTLDPS